MKKKTFTKVLVTSAMATSLLAPQVLGAVSVVAHADENTTVTAEATPETTVQESLQEVIQEVASEPVAEVVAEPVQEVAEPVAEPVQEVVEPVVEELEPLVVEELPPVTIVEAVQEDLPEPTVPEAPVEVTPEAEFVEKATEKASVRAVFGNLNANVNWNVETDAFRTFENAKKVTVNGLIVGLFQQSDGQIQVYFELPSVGGQIVQMKTIPIVEGTTQSQTYDLESTIGEEGTMTVNVTFSKEAEIPVVKPNAPTNVRVSKNTVVANVGANTSTVVYDEKGNDISGGGYYSDYKQDLTIQLTRDLKNGEKIYLVSETPDGVTNPKSDKAWATYVAPETVLKSTVTIRGVDSKTGKELYSRSETVDRGTVYTAQADMLKGYNPEGQLIVDLVMENATHTHTFYYTPIEDEVLPDKYSNITVNYIDMFTGEVIGSEVIKNVQVGTERLLTAKKVDGYKVEGQSSMYYTVVEGENIVSFYYVVDATEPVDPETPVDPEVPVDPETPVDPDGDGNETDIPDEDLFPTFPDIDEDDIVTPEPNPTPEIDGVEDEDNTDNGNVNVDTPVDNDKDNVVTDTDKTENNTTDKTETDKETVADKDNSKKEESKTEAEKAKEDELKKAGQKSISTTIATVMAMFGFGLVWFSTKAKKEQDEK